MRTGPTLILLSAILMITVAIGSMAWQVTTAYKGYGDGERIVIINAGQPARSTAHELQEAGVIRSALAFRVLMKISGAEEDIQAGEYLFTDRTSPLSVLDKLTSGDVMRHRLTMPEGLRLDEVAALVEAAGFASRDDFIEAGQRSDLVDDLDPEALDLEGYLYPDTYYFARGTTPDQMVTEMVARFRQELSPEKLDRMDDLGLTVRKAITLASLIEEEARAEDERVRISSVFHNRLERRMLLQCDPTVVYALIREGKYRGQIYRSDLAFESDYNTYVRPGLPPGPISNPGGPSIDAALNPAETKDLYFVVSGPGRHEFSTNVKDHERAVQRYRREMSLMQGTP